MKILKRPAGCLMAVLLVLISACGKRESRLKLEYPRYEGEKVELISFMDSTLLKTGVVKDGILEFDNSDILTSEPLIAQVVIDGRVKGFFIVEEGMATLPDSLSVATGTPLNDNFSRQIHELDSVEDLNDMIAYADFAKQRYELNKGNVLGDYFGLEWLKYGEPKEVLSMLQTAPAHFRDSKRVARFKRYAELRARTAVGEPYSDIVVPQPDGREKRLSDYVKPGNYTLVDFWASWCPYCIKELPELKELYSKYRGKGFEIVGVAVRDEIADTDASIKRHGITWPVISNAQKGPYDIYGFSGIPHLVLIGPDGKIVARGESAARTALRLKGIFDN